MKKTLTWIAAGAVIMLGLPWCVKTFVSADGAMMCSILLLYIVFPAFIISAGAAGGRSRDIGYCVPFSVLMSMLGMHVFLGMDTTTALFYAAAWAALGFAAALGSWWMCRVQSGRSRME